ncbi:GtrA family protein [Cryobacterium sp. Y57]|uniref:GtrA family protein n=1 Tax=Cryobacterium sp. Y57 TaxID=2048287 RepID=UPI000CE3E3AF|nr:GtrA family protein [Cryobacterium sp. Y57]
MHRFWNRLAKLARDQRLRFLAVGGVNTVVGYALFAVFDLFVFATVPFGYLLSLMSAYAIAIVLAFVLYRRFVFKVTGRVWSDFVKFVSVYLVAIGVNLLTLPLLIEVAGLNSLVAQAIVLIATTFMSFFGHREFSFRREPEAEF